MASELKPGDRVVVRLADGTEFIGLYEQTVDGRAYFMDASQYDQIRNGTFDMPAFVFDTNENYSHERLIDLNYRPSLFRELKERPPKPRPPEPTYRCSFCDSIWGDCWCSRVAMFFARLLGKPDQPPPTQPERTDE